MGVSSLGKFVAKMLSGKGGNGSPISRPMTSPSRM